MNVPGPGAKSPPEAGWRQLALLVLLACIWSSSFMFIKIGVATIPPVTMAAARLTLAAVLLVVIARFQGYRFPFALRAWGLFTFVGVMGNAVPFTLIAWGELEVDSGLAAILMGVMPVATAVLAHAFVRDERLTRRRAAGVLLGFSGIVLLVGASALYGLGAQVAAQLAVVIGALCYAVTTVFVRRFANLPDVLMAAGAMTTGSLAMLPLAFIFESPLAVTPSLSSVASVAVLGIVSTGVAALIYFYLIRTVGAAIFSQVNFLTPAIGVAFGMIFLGELPGGDAWSALALIVTGVWLVTRRSRPHRRPDSG
jgi:drug/metabolite transporter (DMT)-like permease